MPSLESLFEKLEGQFSEPLRRELVLRGIGRILASLRAAFPRAVTGGLVVRTGQLLDSLSHHPDRRFVPPEPPAPDALFSEWRAALAPFDPDYWPTVIEGLESALVRPVVEAERIIRSELVATQRIGEVAWESLVQALQEDHMEAMDLYHVIGDARHLNGSPSWALLDDDLDGGVDGFTIRLRHAPEVDAEELAKLLGSFLSSLNEAHIAGGGSGFVVRRATVGEFEPHDAEVLT